MVDPLEVLQQYWGFKSFRPPQQEVIETILEGESAIVLLPTGGGKSVCFQVPGLMMDGLCLVVSPLISLMRDQLTQLEEKGINAKAVFAGMSEREMDITLDNCIYGNVKFLYVSPERLKSPLFLARAEKMKISLLAIDEAHCISQWGYDFRPSYLEISAFIDLMKIPTVMALTATATPTVKKDIIEKLGMNNPKVFTSTFSRPNLSFSVFKLENHERKLLSILNNVKGSSIIYVRSRKRTQQVAARLNYLGIESIFYHAGLSPLDREKREKKWLADEVRVIVATNAFGMGIDKPNVRTVIHLDLPDAIESYYQEAGRAGRDGKKSYAILLYNEPQKTQLWERMERSQTEPQVIRQVYQALANFFKLAIGSHPSAPGDFDIEKFSSTYNLSTYDTFNALAKLQELGLIQLDDSFYRSSQVIFLVKKEELYKFQVAHPNLEQLIKATLRLYGGELFVSYLPIKESEIAKLLKVPTTQIITWLRLLASYEIVDYIEFRNHRKLGFLKPRMEPAQLPIKELLLKERTRVAMEKAESMIGYAESQDRCRMRILQQYFGEATDQNCGICDYCLNLARSGNHVSPTELLQFLETTAPVSLDEVIVKFESRVSRDSFMESIRILIDEEKIRINEDRIHFVGR